MAPFDLHKFLQLLSTFGPMILLMVPGGAQYAMLIPVIINGISEAEQIPGATGQQKKAHVLKILDDAVIVANATGHVTLDRAEIAEAAGDAIDALILILKIVAGAKVPKVVTPVKPQVHLDHDLASASGDSGD